MKWEVMGTSFKPGGNYWKTAERSYYHRGFTLVKDEGLVGRNHETVRNGLEDDLSTMVTGLKPRC